MSITTLDGVIAGMTAPQEFYKVGAGTLVVGRMYSLAYAAGLPGAMTTPAPGIQGISLSSYAGQIPFTNPGAGNTYMARLAAESTQAGVLLLCDRVWHNSGNSATSTSAQTHTLTATAISQANPTQITVPAHGQTGTFRVHITGSNSTPSVDGSYLATYVDSTNFTVPVNVSVAGTTAVVYIAVPPRDANGVYNGAGVLIGYEVSSAMGSGTPTLTATYVNSAGTAGQVTPSITLTASYPVGTFIPLPLAAGDLGVRAIASHTKNATQNSGTYHIVLYRVISRVAVLAGGLGAAADAVTAGFPRLYNDSVPFLVWLPGTTTAPNVSGQLIVAQG